MTENFTPKQLDALELLKKHYPRGISTPHAEHREVYDSLIERNPDMVEKVTGVDTATGDAYMLTDAGADSFREDADERAVEAENN